METKRAAAVYPLAMTAVLAALMAVAAPFSVAIGPVPLSFCTLVIYLAGYLLGGRRAALATLAYILLGAVGMPVFSGFSAGLGVLAGPTGGYVVGYLPLAALSGLAASRFPGAGPSSCWGWRGGPPSSTPWAPPGTASSRGRPWPPPWPPACSPSCPATC